MLLINGIQKEIYSQLANSGSDNIKKLQGIFNSPPVNTKFPYLTIAIENMDIEKNCNGYDNYLLNSTIKIFDRNETNGGVIAIADDVMKELSGLVNINVDNFLIIDLINMETNFEVFHDITSVWNCVLKFTIIIKRIRDES